MRGRVTPVLFESLESRRLLSHTTPDIVATYKGETKGKVDSTLTIHITAQTSRNVIYGTLTDVLEGKTYTENLVGRVTADSFTFTFSGNATGTFTGAVTSRHRIFTLSGNYDNKTLDSTGTFSAST